MSMATIHHIVGALIQGRTYPTDYVVRATGLELTQEQLDAAAHALWGINDRARQWAWSDVQAKLDQAYIALGALHEGPNCTAHDFHRGHHPCQEDQ